MEREARLKLLAKVFNIFSLDVSYLSNRIRIQKIIYLLQNKGLDLGYSFSFYIYGPYCSDLATDAYTVCADATLLSNMATLTETESHTIFNIKKIIDLHKDDSSWCELLGTLVYLIKEEHVAPAELFARIVAHQSYLNDKSRFVLALNLVSENGLS